MTRRSNVSVNDVLQLYNQGMSVKKIAKHFGVARGTIVSRLHEGGIIQRGKSESMYLRMSQASPEERSRLAAAAHAALRGKKPSFEHRHKVALTKERDYMKWATGTEIACANELHNRGLTCVLQKACGTYSIDIAIIESHIAVELFGGEWHCHGRHAADFPKRFKYLLDNGWLPVIVWVENSRQMVEPLAIDYIVALSQKVCSGEAVENRYMIRSDGRPDNSRRHKLL